MKQDEKRTRNLKLQLFWSVFAHTLILKHHNHSQIKLAAAKYPNTRHFRRTDKCIQPLCFHQVSAG